LRNSSSNKIRVHALIVVAAKLKVIVTFKELGILGQVAPAIRAFYVKQGSEMVVIFLNLFRQPLLPARVARNVVTRRCDYWSVGHHAQVAELIFFRFLCHIIWLRHALTQVVLFRMSFRLAEKHRVTGFVRADSGSKLLMRTNRSCKLCGL